MIYATDHYLYISKFFERGGLWRHDLNNLENRVKISDTTPVYFCVMGKWIYYLTDKSDCYRIFIDGSRKKLIDINVQSFSTTDQYFYYVKDYKLFRNRHDESEHKMISNSSSMWVITDNHYVYSVNVDDNWKIYRSDLEGQNRKCISRHGGIIPQIMDGYIYYLGRESAVSTNSEYIYRTDIDGTIEIKLSDNKSNDFTCYNGEIYFVNNNYNDYVFVIDSQGQNLRQLTNIPSGVMNILGDTIYYGDQNNRTRLLSKKINDYIKGGSQSLPERVFGGNASGAMSVLDNSCLFLIAGKENCIIKPFDAIIESIYLEPKVLPWQFKTDVVLFMQSEFNEKKEDLDSIIQICAYKKTALSYPVFFADTTIWNSRKKGFLVASDGIYLSNKNRLLFGKKFNLSISLGEIRYNNTLIGSFSGGGKTAEYIAEFIKLVYVFCYLKER